MRILITMIVFVSSASAFGADVVWDSGTPPLQPYRYDQPRVPLPKTFGVTSSNPQTGSSNPQQHPQNVLLPTSPQPSAGSSQTGTRSANEKKEEELQIAREANEIARDAISSGWKLGVVQVFLVIVLIVQFGVAAAALYYAKVAAYAAKESVRVATDAMKVANRAYLSVKEWEVDLHPNIGIKANCRLYNTGQTPATILKWQVTLDTDRNDTLPPPLTPACLQSKGENETVIGAQGSYSLLMGAGALLPDLYRGVQENFVPLYLLACFIYSDVFGQKWWVSSTGRYVPGSDIVFMIEGNGYNCSKEYKEEDWNRPEYNPLT